MFPTCSAKTVLDACDNNLSVLLEFPLLTPTLHWHRITLMMRTWMGGIRRMTSR